MFGTLIIILTTFTCRTSALHLDEHLPWAKGNELIFTAYDCNDVKEHRLVQYEEGKKCLNKQEMFHSIRNRRAVIIQDSDHLDFPAFRCSATQTRKVYDCGWESYTSPLNWYEFYEVNMDISKDECRRAILLREFETEDGREHQKNQWNGNHGDRNGDRWKLMERKWKSLLPRRQIRTSTRRPQTSCGDTLHQV